MKMVPQHQSRDLRFSYKLGKTIASQIKCFDVSYWTYACKCKTKTCYIALQGTGAWCEEGILSYSNDPPVSGPTPCTRCVVATQS